METYTHFIHSDPEILGGTLVFTGTRVPFDYLLDYLEHGSTINEFVFDYPSVTKDIAAKALSEASMLIKKALHARAA